MPKILRVIWNEESGEVERIDGLSQFNSTELMDVREDLIAMLEKAALRSGGEFSQETRKKAGWT